MDNLPEEMVKEWARNKSMSPVLAKAILESEALRILDDPQPHELRRAWFKLES